jgi:uncharacterized protein YqeY
MTGLAGSIAGFERALRRLSSSEIVEDGPCRRRESLAASPSPTLDASLGQSRTTRSEPMLREKITADMKDAMRAGEKAKVSTLRLMNNAIKQADIEARPKGVEAISDAEVLQVFAKMIKQRRDSVEQFTAGGRPELAESEQAEIAVIESYMPKQMSDDEVKAAATAIIGEIGAAGMKDLGKVIAAMKEKFAGQMDFGKASGLVKDLLK